MENEIQETKNTVQAGNEVDIGSRYLSGALKRSFIVLQVIMVVLAACYFADGVKIIGSDEQALVLKLGKIRDIGESRIWSSGLHFTWPRPFAEVVRISVAKRVNGS